MSLYHSTSGKIPVGLESLSPSAPSGTSEMPGKLSWREFPL